MNNTNVTNNINVTIIELNKTSVHEKIAEESLFVLDSASLIGIFIAFAVVLLTLGELTYGCHMVFFLSSFPIMHIPQS